MIVWLHLITIRQVLNVVFYLFLTFFMHSCMSYHVRRLHHLKVHSCAQTWYLSILKCNSRVVVHSSIWTLCIPKCAYGAHKACFTLKHFDLGNHRNMYLHNARASTDMTLWTCTYTYMREHWIDKTWPNSELVETENIHVYFSFKGQYNINEYLYEKRDSGLKRKKKNQLVYLNSNPRRPPKKLPRLLWLE